MPKPDYNYRPNPARSVGIFEPFSQALLGRLAPKILELRHASQDPITVYINSPGGSTRVLDVLDGLLRGADADGVRHRIITVVVGDANSAAATLLGLGSYAIAHSHAQMHFHGGRLPVVEELTAEKASDSAGLLAELNRKVAMRLATVMLGRLTLRYLQLRPEFASVRQRLNLRPEAHVPCFVECVKERVSDFGDDLLDRAVHHMGRLAHVSRSLRKAKFKESDSQARSDQRVFQAVLEFEVKEHQDDDWRLNENGVHDVVTDYFLLRDYFFGPHLAHLKAAIARCGASFLSDDEFEEYESKRVASPDEAHKWMSSQVEDQVRQFWHFAVCLCRFMQAGENPLDAKDAYWLGIVDEVVGSDLHGSRSIMEAESTAVPAPTTESNTEQEKAK